MLLEAYRVHVNNTLYLSTVQIQLCKHTLNGTNTGMYITFACKEIYTYIKSSQNLYQPLKCPRSLQKTTLHVKYSQQAPRGIVGRCWCLRLIDGQPEVDAHSYGVVHVCHILSIAALDICLQLVVAVILHILLSNMLDSVIMGSKCTIFRIL